MLVGLRSQIMLRQKTDIVQVMRLLARAQDLLRYLRSDQFLGIGLGS